MMKLMISNAFPVLSILALFVVGSAIFKQPDYGKAIQDLTEAINSADGNRGKERMSQS